MIDPINPSDADRIAAASGFLGIAAHLFTTEDAAGDVSTEDGHDLWVKTLVEEAAMVDDAEGLIDALCGADLYFDANGVAWIISNV